MWSWCDFNNNEPNLSTRFVFINFSLASKENHFLRFYFSEEIARQLEMSGSKYVITIGLFLDNIREAVKIAGGVEKIIVLGMEETPEDCISFLQMVIMDDGSLYDEREPTNVYEDIVVLPFSSGTTGT